MTRETRVTRVTRVTRGTRGRREQGTGNELGMMFKTILPKRRRVIPLDDPSLLNENK